MLVRMLSTFAPSSCSIARLISILFASGATWNTIVRPSSRRIDVFSVMSGRRMTSVSFMISPAPPAASRARRASRPRGAAFDHVARGHAARSARASRRRCCAPTRDSFSSSATSMSTALPVDAEPLQHADRRLGLDLADASARRRRSSAPSCSFCGERRAQRAALDLLRQLDSRSCAAAARTPCRRGATAGSGSSRRARGRCPSAATASCRCR